VRKRIGLIPIGLYMLSAFFAACGSDAEREASRKVKPKSVIAADGSIHLTPEQVQANGIQTAAAVEQQVTATITALGRVVARAGGEAQVFSPFAGRLVADPAKIPRLGSAVKKGEIIAEVEQLLTASETAQFRATAAGLETNIVQARQDVNYKTAELNRAKQLYEGGAIAPKQLQTAEFNLKQAEAQLDGARHAKDQYEKVISQHDAGPRRTPIRAPISGSVIAAELTAGQQTDTSKSLLTIVDLSSVWVEAAIHETDLAAVRGSRRAEIVSPAIPDRTYTGTLITIAGTVDLVNRTTMAVFAVSNQDARLKIGMTAEARIPSATVSKALLIPSSAVLSEEGHVIVFVETEPGVYRRRQITAAQRSGDNVVVSAGLSPSEKVVSVGAESLRGESQKEQIPDGS
jgi:cobalt-zinc-cadmium efflux system membrane fusion protein